MAIARALSYNGNKTSIASYYIYGPKCHILPQLHILMNLWTYPIWHCLWIMIPFFFFCKNTKFIVPIVQKKRLAKKPQNHWKGAILTIRKHCLDKKIEKKGENEEEERRKRRGFFCSPNRGLFVKQGRRYWHWYSVTLKEDDFQFILHRDFECEWGFVNEVNEGCKYLIYKKSKKGCVYKIVINYKIQLTIFFIVNEADCGL